MSETIEIEEQIKKPVENGLTEAEEFVAILLTNVQDGVPFRTVLRWDL